MPTLESGRSIGEVAGIIHAAVLLGPAAWGREPMPEAHMAGDIEDRLRAQLIDLFGTLHQRNIPYLLVGGIAMLTYIEGRNTKDVDLVMSVESLERIPEIVISDRNREFARGKFGDLAVDFLFNTVAVFKLVEEQYAVSHRFLEMDIRCATIEGLILLKLFALPSLYRQGRGQKIGVYESDVFVLYELGRPKMEPIFTDLKPFLSPGEMTELRDIVAGIQRRVELIDRSKRPLGPDEMIPPG
jgi:hypothetical protein